MVALVDGAVGLGERTKEPPSLHRGHRSQSEGCVLGDIVLRGHDLKSATHVLAPPTESREPNRHRESRRVKLGPHIVDQVGQIYRVIIRRFLAAATTRTWSACVNDGVWRGHKG